MEGDFLEELCRVPGEVQPWQVHALVHVEPVKSTQEKTKMSMLNCNLYIIPTCLEQS